MSAIGYFMNSPWEEKKEMLAGGICMGAGGMSFGYGYLTMLSSFSADPASFPISSYAFMLGGALTAIYGFARMQDD